PPGVERGVLLQGKGCELDEEIRVSGNDARLPVTHGLELAAQVDEVGSVGPAGEGDRCRRVNALQQALGDGPPRWAERGRRGRGRPGNPSDVNRAHVALADAAGLAAALQPCPVNAQFGGYPPGPWGDGRATAFLHVLRGDLSGRAR